MEKNNGYLLRLRAASRKLADSQSKRYLASHGADRRPWNKRHRSESLRARHDRRRRRNDSSAEPDRCDGAYGDARYAGIVESMFSVMNGAEQHQRQCEQSNGKRGDAALAASVLARGTGPRHTRIVAGRGWPVRGYAPSHGRLTFRHTYASL